MSGGGGWGVQVWVLADAIDDDPEDFAGFRVSWGDCGGYRSRHLALWSHTFVDISALHTLVHSKTLSHPRTHPTSR